VTKQALKTPTSKKCKIGPVKKQRFAPKLSDSKNAPFLLTFTHLCPIKLFDGASGKLGHTSRDKLVARGVFRAL